MAREADKSLFSALSAGDYCYVLAPRQVGKTSLCSRVAERLKDAGARIAFVDLAALGTTASFHDWLYSIAWEVAEAAGVAGKLDATWNEEVTLPPGARFARVMSELIAPAVPQTLVVFLDEIDAVLGRNVPESQRRAEATEFFWSLRSLHNLRARDAHQSRLSFCLVGVASPADLVQETGKSPFAVSRAIELFDFGREELAAFEPHLCPETSNAGALLDEVFVWTEGHPYMVQHLCDEISGAALCDAARDPKEVVRVAVDRRFLGPRRRDDVVLGFAHHYVSRHNRDFPLAGMLDVYRKLLDKGPLRYDADSDAHLRLILAGLVRLEARGKDSQIRIRNRVIREVFDKAWLDDRESELHLGEPLLRWQRAPEGKKADFVLRGAALRQALDWQQARDDLSPQERNFIEASLQVELRDREREVTHERDLKEKEEAKGKQRQAEERTKRILQVGGVGLGALALVLGVVVNAYRNEQALSKKLKAKEERVSTLLEARRLVQDARVVAKNAVPPSQEGPAPTADSVFVRALKSVGEAGAAMNDMQLAAPLIVLLHEAPLPQRTFEAQKGWAQSVAWSPDGARIVVGDDGGATLWDAKGGKSIRRLALPEEESIRAIRFSPDSRWVVIGGKNGGLSVWDAATGQSQQTLTAHSARVSSISFFRSDGVLTSGDDGKVALHTLDGKSVDLLPPGGSVAYITATSPDRTVLAAGTEEGVIHLWDSSGHKLGELRAAGQAQVYDLSFSPDGALLLAGDSEGGAHLWEVASQKPRCQAGGHTDAIAAVTFSSDGTSFITGSYDGTVRRWKTEGCEHQWTNTAASSAVVELAFLSGGARVAAASTEGYIRILDGKDGRLRNTLVAHGAATRDLAVSPDEEQIVTAGVDGRATVWDVPEGRPLLDLQGPSKPLEATARIRDISYSKNGQYLFAGNDAGFVHIWATATGELLHTEKAHNGAVGRIIAGPRGGFFVSGGTDGRAFLWQDSPPFSKKALPGGESPSSPPCKSIQPGAAGLLSAAVDPSGALVAAAGADCLVRLWSTTSGELRAVLAGHEAEVLSLSFSPSGGLLASEDGRGQVRVWETAAGALKKAIPTATIEPDPRYPEQSPVAWVQFLSEDRLLSGVKYETAKIWDLTSGEKASELSVPGHWLLRSELRGPEGSFPEKILTASWDQSARLWDAKSGKLKQSLWGHDGPVRKAIFSGDGQVIWTISEDGHLRVWNASEGDLVGEVRGGLGDLWDGELSPDGKHIAVAGERGRVRIFPATLKGFFRQACHLLMARPSYAEVRSVCADEEKALP